MTPEEIWRLKGDDEVRAAMSRLVEYTADGQQVIVSEAGRRGLATVPATGEVAIPAVDRPDHTSAPLSQDFPVSIDRLREFWRGERSLGESFWLWAVAIKTVLIIVVGLATLYSDRLFILSVGLVWFTAAVVCTVGVWRSAARYQGRFIWPLLARLGTGYDLLRASVLVLLGVYRAI